MRCPRCGGRKLYRNPVEPDDTDLIRHLYELKELVNSNPHWHNWVRLLEHANKTGVDVFIKHPEYNDLLSLESVSRGGRVVAGNALAIHPDYPELGNEISITSWQLRKCRAYLRVYTPEIRHEKRKEYWERRKQTAIKALIYGRETLEDVQDINEYRDLYYRQHWEGYQYPETPS